MREGRRRVNEWVRGSDDDDDDDDGACTLPLPCVCVCVHYCLRGIGWGGCLSAPICGF